MPNIEALEQLKRVVRDAPTEQFKMSTWGNPSGTCGTVRCAAGHALFDPWHRENTPIASLFYVSPTGYIDGVSDDGCVDMRALGQIYGITKGNTEKLFLGEHSAVGLGGITKDQVIAKIDDLIDGRGLRAYGD